MLAMILLLWAWAAGAVAPLVVRDETSWVEVRDHATLFVDEGEMSFEEVRALPADRWLAVGDFEPIMSWDLNRVWLRIELRGELENPEQFWLVPSDAPIADVRAHTQRGDGSWRVMRSGRLVSPA